MKLTPISSSLIGGYHYDEERKQLTLEFSDGARYNYDRITKKIVDEFVSSESPGSFFHKQIKNHYPTTKLPHE